jgi:Tol biopolymer transport system component
VRLTNTPRQYKGVAGVSPDARKILFTRIDPGRFEQIFVMDVDGTHTRRISRGDYDDWHEQCGGRPGGRKGAHESLLTRVG